MAKTETSTTDSTTETKPSNPTARDVVAATSAIVNAIEHLPAPLQVRALVAAGTTLGLHLTTRGSEQTRQQQRPPQNSSQQSNGQQRGNR